MGTITDTKNNECKNCNNSFEGNYCNYCGQPADQKRITISFLWEKFLHGFFHLNRGLFYTLAELFVRPGTMLRGYIAGKRINHINPFTYLVLISLVGGFIYTWSGILYHQDQIFLASGETINFTSKHFSARMLLMIPINAILCSVLFKSFKYNFAEHLIINTFLICQSIVFLIVGMLVYWLVKPDNMSFKILYSTAFVSVIIYQMVGLFLVFNKGNQVLRWLKVSAVVIIGLGLSFIVMNYLAKVINIF
jgi:hypothetical protein